MDAYEADKSLGTVVFRQNSRIRKLAIRIAGRAVIVQFPLECTLKTAKSFLEEHRMWAESVLRRCPTMTSTVIDENTELELLNFKIILKHDAKQNRCYATMDLQRECMVMHAPVSEDIYSEDIQKRIDSLLFNILMLEAKHYLPGRLNYLSEKFGLTYAECQIRKMKSRWGSCISKSIIHLSSLLMALPQELSDFVILHELCHTREMNHGKNFYALLNRVTENRADEFKKKLNDYAKQPTLSILFALA